METETGDVSVVADILGLLNHEEVETLYDIARFLKRDEYSAEADDPPVGIIGLLELKPICGYLSRAAFSDGSCDCSTCLLAIKLSKIKKDGLAKAS